ncbi:MAG: phosphoadenylyl-sulfate reductase [Bacteroidetes bacterium]|nr:MAG: phosphoadenylyl-sulfate reductase [Bacteroidota bacterium]
MYVQPIINALERLKLEGKSMFATSSFQSQSNVLLHLISITAPEIPVYFIDTGYHFPETIVHKNNIASILGLRVIDLKPMVSKHLQRDAAGNLLFTFDPDYCCYLNKVQPIEELFSKFDIWINGIRAEQSSYRNNLSEFEPTGGKTVRYHPLLNWTREDIEEYLLKHNLPAHPLEMSGYKSIGCEPCTRPVQADDNRQGRWFGMKKTECGLHSEKTCCNSPKQ